MYQMLNMDNPQGIEADICGRREDYQVKQEKEKN